MICDVAAAIFCADYIADGLHGGGGVRSGVSSTSLCALECVLQPKTAATCCVLSVVAAYCMEHT